MRFGVCAGPEKAALLRDAGYDYIELSVARDLMSHESEADFRNSTFKNLMALPLPIETFNLFLKGGKIVGPEVDFAGIRSYVSTAFRRAASVGGQLIVFGSGGARRVPEDFDVEIAQRQLRDFLNLVADASDETGIQLAIEPLRHAESNLINFVSEGASLAREINRTGIGVLGDTFHMDSGAEPLQALFDARDYLNHIHVADTGRLAPGTGTYDYVALFRTLYQAGYDRRVSVECTFHSDFESEINISIATLKQADKISKTITD